MMHGQKNIKSCVTLTLPIDLYTGLILLMMSSKPARNM